MEIEINDTNFKKEVLDETILPVLVDFWAPWCGPCKMIAPSISKIADKYPEKLKVCKLNVDDSPQTSADYGIMSIPTLIIFKKGKITDKIIGALPEAALEEKIKAQV